MEITIAVFQIPMKTVVSCERGEWERGMAGLASGATDNVLSLDLSEGYTDASVDQNSSNCTL